MKSNVWKRRSSKSRGERKRSKKQEAEAKKYSFSVSLLLCISVSLLLITGCQYRVPKDPKTLFQGLPTDPDTLNPVITNSGYAMAVTGFIFDQLFELDNETLQPKPRLAQRWEIAPNHLQYTFHLRDDVKWHDGEPFSADDVIYTYEKIQDPKVDAAPLRNYFKDVLKVEKLDNHTVRFTYRQPYVGALYTLGLMTIIPKHIYDDGQEFNTHPKNRAPVGTGPFEFVEWKTGRRVVLKKFEKHWAPVKDIHKMVFQIIPDELATFQLFKKKDLDFIELKPLQWVKQTNSPKFSQQFVKHKFFTPSGVYNYIGWNLKKPYFKDSRVRLALAHLVDLPTIDKTLLYDLYSIVTGPYYPLGRNYNKTLEPIGYDLEKAKQLLDEAGWKDTDGDGIRDKDGIPLRFTLLFSSGLQFYEQLTPILKNNFLRAGIEIELRRLEAVTLFKMLEEHDFDAYMAGWGRGVGEEDLYQIWHSSQSQGGSNFVNYANAEVDRLLEEGRREFDDKKRAQLYQQVHKILYDEQPYLFLFARPDLMARDSRFKNVKEYPLGLDLREWVVEE